QCDRAHDEPGDERWKAMRDLVEPVNHGLGAVARGQPVRQMPDIHAELAVTPLVARIREHEAVLRRRRPHLTCRSSRRPQLWADGRGGDRLVFARLWEAPPLDHDEIRQFRWRACLSPWRSNLLRP